MSVIVRYQSDNDIPEPSMKSAVMGSVLFHATLFILTAVGIPFVVKDTTIISTPISIEIVDIAEITQSPKPPAPKPPEEKKPIEAKAPAPENPAPPKMEEVAPPEPEKPKPVEKKAEIEKPKPKPKVKPKPKTEEKKQETDFDTLLKNLTPDAAPKVEESVDPVEDAAMEESPIAQLGDRLTMSEEDAIRRQITPCWNVQAGAKFAEDLAVEIRVFMNRDGSIRDTTILDSGRYNRDSHFRAAADAAERALRNPNCTPLKYPPEKYEQMKAFVFRFDPKDML